MGNGEVGNGKMGNGEMGNGEMGNGKMGNGEMGNGEVGGHGRECCTLSGICQGFVREFQSVWGVVSGHLVCFQLTVETGK